LLHQTQKIKKMKARTIIIATVIFLQVSFLFADNNEVVPTVNNDISLGTISTLAPVTPVEADFSDVVPEKNIDMTILAPVTPSEADFNDNTEDQTLNLTALAPVTPAEADFE